MRRLTCLFLAALGLPALADETPTAEQLFTMNCSACHLPNQQVVGPSLVEIRKLYNGKPDLFIEWAKNPVQKRKGAIEMPSMAHIPDEQLKLIYDHILEISKGLEEVKQEKGDPFALSPTVAQRPNLLRTFMPDAGPAAIAVAIDHTWSYCWDAGPCRLRYIWQDGFVDSFPVWRGNGNGLAKIIGTRVLTEEEHPLVSLGGDEEPEFLGYLMEDGLPTFHYRLGRTKVSERLFAEGDKLHRQFTLNPAPNQPLRIKLAEQDGVTWTTDDGRISDGILTLQKTPAAAFTLTLVQP